MYIQRSYIENALSLGATSGTKTIDLPKSAFLSALLIRFKATNGATANRDNHIHDKIDKIEVIVDGSTVVKSLTGKQCQAIAYYATGSIPLQYMFESADLEQWDTFPIYFGRFPGDKEYGLDTHNHVNPQLKITWDTTGADGVPGQLFSVAVFPTIDVWIEQFVDVEMPLFMKGYIKAHQILSWSPTSDSERKRVELPTGNLYKAVYVEHQSTAWRPEQGLAKMYLDLNIGERQPIKVDTEEWLAFIERLYGETEICQRVDNAGGVYARKTKLGRLAAMSVTPSAAAHFGGSMGGSGQRFDVHTYDAGGGEAEIPAWWICKGICYHGFMPYPFDYPDESYMLDSSKWSDVDLVLEAAAAGIAVILPTDNTILEEVIVK